jgi:hypothetical protein
MFYLVSLAFVSVFLDVLKSNRLLKQYKEELFIKALLSFLLLPPLFPVALSLPLAHD